MMSRPDDPKQCPLPVLELHHAVDRPLVGNSTTAVHAVDHNITGVVELLMESNSMVKPD